MGTMSGSGGYPFPPKAGGGGGGGTIDFDKLNRDLTKSRRDERNNDTVIPAGWASLSIQNTSIQGPILVNGEEVHAQGNWQSGNVIDWAAFKQEFGEQVTIISNDQPFVFHVIYPTSSAVDVSTI